MLIVSVQNELKINVEASEIGEFAKNAFFVSSGEAETSCECVNLLLVAELTFTQ
jgi:hypothetical protein